MQKYKFLLQPCNYNLKNEYYLQSVGCDMRVGSNKNTDACGVCGGDGSTCGLKYAWTMESTSDCSESCGGGAYYF